MSKTIGINYVEISSDEEKAPTVDKTPNVVSDDEKEHSLDITYKTKTAKKGNGKSVVECDPKDQCTIFEPSIIKQEQLQKQQVVLFEEDKVECTTSKRPQRKRGFGQEPLEEGDVVRDERARKELSGILGHMQKCSELVQEETKQMAKKMKLSLTPGTPDNISEVPIKRKVDDEATSNEVKRPRKITPTLVVPDSAAPPVRSPYFAPKETAARDGADESADEEEEEEKKPVRAKKTRASAKKATQVTHIFGIDDFVPTEIKPTQVLTSFGPYHSTDDNKILYSEGKVFIPAEFLQAEKLSMKRLACFNTYNRIKERFTMYEGAPELAIIPEISIVGNTSNDERKGMKYMAIDLGFAPASGENMTEANFGFAPYCDTLETFENVLFSKTNYKTEVYMSMTIMRILSIFGRKLSSFYIRNGKIFFLGYYTSGVSTSKKWPNTMDSIYGIKLHGKENRNIMEYENPADFLWLHAGISSAKVFINASGTILLEEFGSVEMLIASANDYAQEAGIKYNSKSQQLEILDALCTAIVDGKF